MAGTVANPRIWLLGDVYVGAVGTTAPTNTTTALNAGFHPLGLLSEDGLTEMREEDSTDHYAWGSILVRTTRSKHKRTFKVSVLEDNRIVFDLVNPGSTNVLASGVQGRTVKVPGSNPKAFVFQMTDGDYISRISIPRAEVTEVGDVVRNEADMVTRELTITVYPTSAGVLYTEYTTDPAAVSPAVSSIALTPATVTLAAAATQQCTVVATLADASTLDVTDLCVYTTSNAAHATVDAAGLITAVATGGPTITATYEGQTDTCVVTVS